MRSVIISVVLLILILITSIWSSRYIKTTANDMATNMEQIMKSIESEDWETINVINSENNEKWFKISKNYSYLINHDEIDTISIYMEELDKYIKMQESANALASAGSLRFLFEHLPKRNDINFQNIF